MNVDLQNEALGLWHRYTRRFGRYPCAAALAAGTPRTVLEIEDVLEWLTKQAYIPRLPAMDKIEAVYLWRTDELGYAPTARDVASYAHIKTTTVRGYLAKLRALNRAPKRTKRSWVLRCQAELAGELGREPTTREVAARSQINWSTVRGILAHADTSANPLTLWFPEEIGALRAAVERGRPWESIARDVHRDRDECVKCAMTHGIEREGPFTTDELEALRDAAAQRMSTTETAILVGRPAEACRSAAVQLGLAWWN